MNKSGRAYLFLYQNKDNWVENYLNTGWSNKVFEVYLSIQNKIKQ